MTTALLTASAVPADLAIHAAADLQSDPAGKRVSITAYNGGLMNVAPWGAVAIDLAGLSGLDAQVRLLADHNATLASIAGFGNASIKAGKLLVSGTVTAATPAGQQILSLAKAGMQLQASIGITPTKYERIPPGQKVAVNGQILQSDQPFILVSSAVLNEVSILALGADRNTTVDIAAASRKEPTMTLSANAIINPINPTNPADPAATLRAAERQRLDKIQAACKGLTGPAVASLQAKAIDEAITYEELQASLLDIARGQLELTDLRASRPAAPIGIQTGHAPATDQVIRAALAIHLGHSEIAASAYGEAAANQADRISHSFGDIAAAALQAAGREIPRDPATLLNAAMSTQSLPVALGDVSQRIIQKTYEDTPATWRAFANIVSMDGLGPKRPAKVLRPFVGGSVEKILPGGAVTLGTITEDVVELYAETFGKLLGTSRQDVLNDDLGVFIETAVALTRMAGRGLSDLVWQTILTNANSHFGTGNKNYQEGSGTALSVESLGAAILLMRSQKDSENSDLDIAPKTLVVPPALEVTARGILKSVELARYVSSTSGDKPTGNPLQDVLDLQVEPRLGNTSKFAGASATKWFIFAAPTAMPLNVGFLKGRQTPILESFTPADTAEKLDYMWRIIHDYGAGLGDPRAAVMSKGAA